ncbi:MAG: amino acid ABC transporter permease [Firmicutes bacterium]|nr:amino acid ABC transporter permease [Bacillota bacterium]
MNQLAWWRWQALFANRSIFVQGLGQTLLASALALGLALVLGVIFGVFAVAPWRLPRWLNRAYVEFIQNTPLVVQVLFLYFGLPYFGLVLPVLWVGVLGLGIYHGAYIAEVVRAGINSVHRGQLEAAYAQGFTYMGGMRYIVLPQAAQVVLPPLTNQALALIKNSAVLAMIAGGDLMYYTDSWSSDTLHYGPAYLVAGVLYLMLTLPLAWLTIRLEAHLGHGQQGVA